MAHRASLQPSRRREGREDRTMRGAVSIKGTREGLTITLGQGEYAELFAELEEHLKTQGAFFRGAKVALQVADL